MRVRAGDVELTGTDTGTGDPVVLLHGLASTHRWWDLVVPWLTGYRVLRFDHRGHGGSSAPPGGYDLGQLAADTLAVLDARGVGRAVLVGHSLGAAVALRVAAAHPSRVAALACVDGGVYDHRRLFGAAWEQARPLMTRPRRGRVSAAVLRAWLASTDLPAAALPAILANYAGAGKDGGLPAAAGTGGALRLRLDAAAEEALAYDLWRLDPEPLLAAVRAPVLVLAARQGDPLADNPRRDALRRARDLLGVRLAVRWVAGGHELPLHRPDQVGSALAEICARSMRDKISATWR